MFLYIQIPITSFLLPCNSTLSEHFGAFRFTANWFFWKFLIHKIWKCCKLHAYKINCNDQQSKTLQFFEPWNFTLFDLKLTILIKTIHIFINRLKKIFEWPFLVPMFLQRGLYSIVHLKASKITKNLGAPLELEKLAKLYARDSRDHMWQQLTTLSQISRGKRGQLIAKTISPNLAK